MSSNVGDSGLGDELFAVTPWHAEQCCCAKASPRLASMPRPGLTFAGLALPVRASPDPGSAASKPSDRAMAAKAGNLCMDRPCHWPAHASNRSGSTPFSATIGQALLTALHLDP